MEKQTNFGGNQTVKSTTQNKEHTGQNARPLEIRCVGNLSVREYFAGLAMQGMLCNGFIPNIVGPDGSTLQSDNYAECAFRMADAMLAEGSKQ